MKNLLYSLLTLILGLVLSGAGCDINSDYTIEYRPGAHSSGENYSQTKMAGESATLRGETYTRDGFTQTGWSTSQNGDNQDYDLNDIYLDDNDITLYPFWKDNNSNGGNSDIVKKRPAVYSMSITGDHNSDFGYHVSYTKLSVMTADGYYEKTHAVDTELSSNAEEWYILETNMYYWQGSAVNLITGQSGSGATSEKYSSVEQTKYYMNLKAGELNGGMVWISEYTIASVRTGSETFLGRDCAKFVYQVTSSDINRRTDYWIDKATGACLKHIDDMQTTDGYVKISWACTEFKIGGASFPSHP